MDKKNHFIQKSSEKIRESSEQTYRFFRVKLHRLILPLADVNIEVQEYGAARTKKLANLFRIFLPLF